VTNTTSFRKLFFIVEQHQQQQEQQLCRFIAVHVYNSVMRDAARKK
jgi:hypothetical protein